MSEHENQSSELNVNEQQRIRREKLAELQAAGRDPFEIVKFDVSHYSKQIHEGFDALEGQKTSVAGRIMTRRIMGKASFCDLADRDGRIQIYVRGEDLGQEAYDEFKKLDIGDIVGVNGEVFKTQKGEISVKADKITLLAKSLRVLPEKYHGLKDHEMRYRQRYVDLIVNPEVRDTFRKRSAIIKGIRDFMDGRGYMEIEGPVLQTIAGGTNARPFVTHHNALDLDMYLRIALELHLKRLIVGGLDRVYEIGRVFRNEGISTRHNPEFTMLELYEAYTDYYGMMELIESMMKKIVKDICEDMVVQYGEHQIDFGKKFEVITMVEAVKKYSGVDFDKIETTEEAKKIAREHNVAFEPHHTKGDIVYFFFDQFAEANLIQPTFVLDHPIEVSHLTKKKPGNPAYTERFELFIIGIEFANAYSELNDPIDQRERFMHQESLREAGDEEAVMIDEDFIMALEYGMPPTGGLGLGIDRFVMLLTNSFSIRDVLLFPTMRPM